MDADASILLSQITGQLGLRAWWALGPGHQASSIHGLEAQPEEAALLLIKHAYPEGIHLTPGPQHLFQPMLAALSPQL